MSRVISSIRRIIALKAKYFDQFKDMALTLWVLNVVGGLSSLINLPKNFTSMVIMTMGCSITIPLFMGSLQMIANNSTLVWSNKEPNIKINTIYIVCSFFIPVLLTNLYESRKESIRRKLRSTYCNNEISRLLKQCSAIKNQLVKFQRIDLGKH